MRKILLFSIGLTFLRLISYGQEDPATEPTWTHTYLIAKEGQRVNRRTFLVKNWLAMDSVAVAQGLFKSYQLYENNQVQDADWDYMVAVEYFTRGTFSDIADEWGIIRSNHETVLIEGLGFQELGSVVRSEELLETK